MTDWSDEQTDDPLYADDRNFYKVEKWTREARRSIACSMPATTSTRRARCSPRPSNIDRVSD